MDKNQTAAADHSSAKNVSGSGGGGGGTTNSTSGTREGMYR